MKRLFDLSIRRKFAVVIIPLILTILVFDYLQIRDHFLDYVDSKRLNNAIVVGVEINHLVHELQKERSISAGFVTSQKEDFIAQLETQRNKTDSTLKKYLEEIQTSDLEDLVELHMEDIENINIYFQRLGDIRIQVDNQDLTTSQVISYYSDINEIALNTVDILINETRDKEIAQRVHAIIYFLKAKEQASIERAVGMQAFTQQEMDYQLYRHYTSIVASQKAYVEDFLIISDKSSEEYYRRTLNGPQVQEFEALQAELFENVDLLSSPKYWYEQSTARINLLKRVEDYMSNQVLFETEDIASDAVRDFWVFLIIDILVAVLAYWLMSTIVTNLLENLSRLDAFTQRVTSGDMSQKVYVQTKDEIGQYAKTFNVMVEEIKKSHSLLKKERDRARFLYRNIYRVYQVVFENVQQGIFLLDKDFKISKLYSKAMEGIFGSSGIAGENFASFMRPMILPREVEALEMFMKHLFNDDMDEDVVNQLNPIEQVKIYTEIEGIVATKHIRVSFSRIYKQDQIINIMVTVSDESESIMLQQHLEEAEAKKKQETEQVLSILKIDPSVLRGFIFNAKKLLREIYNKYEAEKSTELQDLLDFTFEQVHNLKGNSVVIGLEFMSSKFHQIEDSIQKLKNQDRINAKDFLSILYEIDSIDQVLTDMNDMLKKVANIYQKFPSEGQVVSNIMVIDSLEKGIETIAKETGKRVSLDFINDSNMIIPEAHINAFKDVMIQLIKNSIVHSIETPEERKKLGKRPSGRLSIVLTESEDGISVSYKDDGQGLNFDKIKETAIKRDIITKFEADQLDEQAVINMLFEKGFSTSDKVDTYSGRGQGMNLVKTILDGQSASFEVASKSGLYFGMEMNFPVKEITDEKPEQG
ncbi:MAG: HAMP domain-containing protein/HPt (histidine-containing phosphotransfer) domain-containing protein [Cyclobacteriaceae bacterium]|jgi:HAMP domain-containing protein/HPt (histidine-containing phosphotransfer) domain-containing protein